MPDLALDLRYLKYAMLVAEHGSFRRAAGAINLSQSTLSRRVQLLERRLGVQLFARNWTGAKLTYAGERFIRDAAIGAGHLHQAVGNLSLVQRGYLGELRVGIMASLTCGFLADLFFSFRSRYPNVEVRLEEGSSQSNAAGVLNGALDAAFISGHPQLPGCHARQLWEERLLVALPTHHRLAALPAVYWDDVRDETFLVSAGGPGPEIEDYLVRQLSGLGFHPKILVQRLGRENLMHMVASGFGLTLTTHSTLGASHHGVTFAPIGDETERVASSIVWPADNRNPTLKKLLELSDALTTSRGRG